MTAAVTLLDELGDRPLGLGTAGFAFGPKSVEQSIATMVAAAERGIRIIDTAAAYTRPGEESTSEALVAQARRQLPPDVLISTKGGHWRHGHDFPVDGRPATLRRHCQKSLRILGVESIDVYHLHHVDPAVDVEDSAGALEDLRREGLIRYIGLSNVRIDQLDAASRVARIDAVQNRLSLAGPSDISVAAECGRRGIAFLAYSPLGGKGTQPPEAASLVAECRGVSPAQVLLAWLFTTSPAVVPLVGATRARTVVDSCSARDFHLTAEDLELLTRAE